MRCQNCNAEIDPKFNRRTIDWEPCVYCKSPISLPIPKSIIDAIDSEGSERNSTQQQTIIQQQEPWHKTKFGVFVLIWTFFPIGIYYFYVSKDISKKFKNIVTAFFCILFLLVVFGQ